MNTTRQQTCLTDEILQKLSQGTLQPMEFSRVEEHIGECGLCRDLLDSLASDEQWQDEFLPVLRQSDEAKVSPGDLEDPARDEPSIETVLKLLGPSDDPHKMGRIGTYEVIGVIGRGGMGVVFKALDPALNRFVAIKMLLPHLAASGAARKRFAREGKAAAAVIDDHVMPIHCVSEWQGIPYLVTQYSRGVTLQKRIQDQGPLELKEILRIGMQIARGLAAAHAQGLVHRDVKPSNILLDGTVERCLLTDFGLARAVDDASITRTGIIAGTPQYMSPEQASGGMVDTRSDLFGLGSVLYAICTGRPPFRADNSFAVLRLITDKEPTPIQEINPDVLPWLSAIVTRLMAKKPEDRFDSASEVAALLEKCLAHVQQPASVPLPPVPEFVVLPDHPITLPRKASIAKRVMVLLGIMLFGAAAILFGQTEPPDIAGDWNGPEWGLVHLKPIQPGQYEGTFSDTVSREPGTIALKWSRIERRYNGNWNEGKGDRFGEISLRAGGATITGAYSTDRLSRVNPETPKLADLTWLRGKVDQTKMTGNPQAKGSFEDPNSKGVESCLKCHASHPFFSGSFGSGKEFWHGDHWSLPNHFPGSSGTQLKGLDPQLTYSFIAELTQVMDLSLGFSINASGEATFRFHPKYGSQSGALAKSLGPVLNQPGIASTDSEKKKHQENCLVLIDELKKFTQIQIKFALLERLNNKTITVAQVKQLEYSRLPESASLMAKTNLELWKQLDSVEVPPSKDSPEKTKKLKDIHTFLTVFFIDPKIVDPIIAKGSSEWPFSFPRLDGRQRLVSLFMALKEGADHELGDLETLKARWGARLEILETLEMLLKKELQSQKSAPGKPKEGGGSSGDPELGGSIPNSPKATVDTLEGVWEVQLPTEITKTVPEDQRTRLVILKTMENPAQGENQGWWQGTFQGSTRLSASPLGLDGKNHRLSFTGTGNQSMHGIFEIKEDGLRLSIAPRTEPLPTHFGTAKPEFKRVDGKLAQEQVIELRQFVKKSNPMALGKPGTPMGPDIAGHWRDAAKTEHLYSIQMVDPFGGKILITNESGLAHSLKWSKEAERFEGEGVLSDGETYGLAVTWNPGVDQLSITSTFDKTWKEKWFRHKAPKYPDISPELRVSLQKEYDDQNQRVWIKMKTGAKTKPEPKDSSGSSGNPEPVSNQKPTSLDWGNPLFNPGRKPDMAGGKKNAIGSLTDLIVTIGWVDAKGIPDPNPNGMAGIVMDSRGLILTTGVFDEPKERQLRVRLHNRQEFQARVVDREPTFGLTVLQIFPNREISALSPSSIREIRVGDAVIPLLTTGFDPIVEGKVMALGKDLGPGLSRKTIETDLKLSPGEAGSLMVSANGNPVGIWCAVRTGQQKIGFAVSLAEALPWIQKVKSRILGAARGVPVGESPDPGSRKKTPLVPGVNPAISRPWDVADPLPATNDPPKNQKMVSALPPLEFRFAANQPGSKMMPTLPADYQKRHYPENTEKARKDSREKGFVWVNVAKQVVGNVSLPVVEFPVGESGKALLADTAEHAMTWNGQWKIEKVKVVPDTNAKGEFGIEVKLNEAGGKLLKALTRTHSDQPLAILVNNEIIAAPIVRGEIGGDLMISGVFTKDQAERIAALLKP